MMVRKWYYLLRTKYINIIFLFAFLFMSCNLDKYNIDYDTALNGKINDSFILFGKWQERDFVLCDLKEKTIKPLNILPGLKGKYSRYVGIDRLENKFYVVYSEKRVNDTYLIFINMKNINDIIEFNVKNEIEGMVSDPVLTNYNIYYRIHKIDQSTNFTDFSYEKYIFKLNIKTLEKRVIEISGTNSISPVGTFDNENILIYENYPKIGVGIINVYNFTTKVVTMIDEGGSVNYNSELSIMVYKKEIDGKQRIKVYDFNTDKMYDTGLSPYCSTYTYPKSRYYVLSNNLLIYHIPRPMNPIIQLINMTDYDPKKDYYLFDYVNKKTLSKIDFHYPWVIFEYYCNDFLNNK